jgi:hypothetical protein
MKLQELMFDIASSAAILTVSPSLSYSTWGARVLGLYIAHVTHIHLFLYNSTDKAIILAQELCVQISIEEAYQVNSFGSHCRHWRRLASITLQATKVNSFVMKPVY